MMINQIQDIYELHSQLCKKLQSNGSIKIISHDFNKLNSNRSRVDFARKILEEHNLKIEKINAEKSQKIATEFKENGNKLFKAKKDDEAWKMYTKSIAFCEANSEHLGICYSNRSAVLFHKNLYKESLIDINYALKVQLPDNIKQKLIKRKEKCEKLLNDQKEEFSEDTVTPVIENKNDKISCASNSISIKFNEEFGRYVVAEKNITVGEILAIETPYTKILCPDYYYNHCQNCFENNANLIPCDNCNWALFCSMKCKDFAWKSFHKYECPIILTLNEFQVNKLTLTALRIAIIARDEFKDIDNFQKIEKNCYYYSDRYLEVHNLIANTEKRSTNDLFERAVIAAFISNLIRYNTSFFEDLNLSEEGEAMFQEVLLLHMQTAPLNFHEISEFKFTKHDSEKVEIGCGAFSFLSLLNHACSPNVVRTSFGSQLVLRALMPIAKGQQIFDNYGYHHCLLNKEERQKNLSKQYYFNCQCVACINDWPLYHNLEHSNIDLDIKKEEISELQKGNIITAKNSIPKLKDKLEKMYPLKPCKEFFDAQEMLKQCFEILNRKNSCNFDF